MTPGRLPPHSALSFSFEMEETPRANDSTGLTSRELVRRTLAFEGPPRLPRQLWTLPWAEIHHPEALAAIGLRFPGDICSAPLHYVEPPPCQGNRYVDGKFVDEWGCVWERLEEGVIGEVKTPPLGDWKALDSLRVPVECLTLDLAKIADFCRGTDRFVVSGVFPRPFEQLQFLRGSENVYYDLADRPPQFDELLATLHEFFIAELELWAKTDVDALMIMDDWGSQHAMLIAPAMWRELFKPLYRNYAEIAHGAGKPLFMHSDGYITDIFPDLIEIGVDAINSQVFCMGVEDLGDAFGGQITFWGELDRQQILPTGTLEEVRDAARRMRSAFHHRGGLIAQCEFGPGARPENVHAFFETLEE